MTTLEGKLNEEQIKNIAIKFGTQNNLSSTLVVAKLSELRAYTRQSEYILALQENIENELDFRGQLKLRRAVLYNLEWNLRTKFPKLREKTLSRYLKKSSKQPSKKLTYADFKKQVIPIITDYALKIQAEYENLNNKSYESGLTVKEVDREETIIDILDNLQSLVVDNHFDGDAQNCKKATEELLGTELEHYLKEENNSVSKLIVKKFANLLNQSGIAVKVRGNNLDTTALVNYIVDLKVKIVEEVKTYLVDSKVDSPKLETADYELVFDGKPRHGGKLLDAYAIGQDFLRDFITFGERVLTTNRQKDALAIARQMVIDKKFPGYNQARAVLGKDRKIKIDELASMLRHNSYNGEQHSNNFNLFSRNGIIGQKELPISGLYLACRDSLITELLDGIGMLGPDFRKAYNDYTMFWNKFNPREFDLKNLLENGLISKVEESYAFATIRNASVLKLAVERAGACLKEHNILAYTSDPATINLIGYLGREPVGYTRMFLTTNQANEPILAADTIEIGHKHFELNSDWVRAMALAAGQLCLDSNAKLLVGKEGRVAYGAKQGFGNKSMPIQLNKIGEPNFKIYDLTGSTGTYSYDFNHHGSTPAGDSSYVLMLNWRRLATEVFNIFK